MLDAPKHVSALEALSQRLGPRLKSDAASIEAHSHDEAHHTPVAPEAVAYASTTKDVADILTICSAHRCPVTAFGVGTSLEGHVVPVRGGISLDLSEMNRIVAVHDQDLDAVVQPGVTRVQLNDALRASGLMFAVDPGANATLGGMAATRASGTNAVRYGTMRETVLALEVALADGRVIRTGSRARKSSAGYDLTRLFVGSEGTLGVITELTVRLHGQPEAVAAATCGFETIEGAVDSTILAIQSGLPMARIELLDEVQMRGMNLYSQLGLPEMPHLFVEFHGTDAGVAEQSERFGEIAAEHGGTGFQWATKTEERNRLWAARHNAYYAAKALRKGAQGYVTDVCVPISQLAACIRETKADLATSSLTAPLVGHVGDGNFHLSILIDPSSAEERAEAKGIAHRLSDRALAMGGTVTGEHGVGLGKMRFMQAEHGEGLAVMADLKRMFDPLNILNPGKIVEV